MPFFKDNFMKLLDFLLPPHCPICKKRTQSLHTLCPECFTSLRFITKPMCVKCGRPFEYQLNEELLCGSCLTKKVPFHKARAALVYDSFSKDLILPFKHADHIELAPLLTNFMEQAGSDLFPETDLLIAVPLHRYRLMKRKYNQAGILAKNLSKRIEKPYYPNVLYRSKYTQSQGHLHANERKRNVAKAFTVKNPHLIKGKRILLIDDVMTSGATLNECAKMLKRNGAKQVSYLTLSRVLKL